MISQDHQRLARHYRGVVAHPARSLRPPSRAVVSSTTRTCGSRCTRQTGSLPCARRLCGECTSAWVRPQKPSDLLASLSFDAFVTPSISCAPSRLHEAGPYPQESLLVSKSQRDLRPRTWPPAPSKAMGSGRGAASSTTPAEKTRRPILGHCGDPAAAGIQRGN